MAQRGLRLQRGGPFATWLTLNRDQHKHPRHRCDGRPCLRPPAGSIVEGQGGFT